MIEIYTGDGKGKTTAAFGLALRAAGHNWRVLIVQFMKGDPEYGEVKAVKFVPGIELHQFGLKTFVKRGSPDEEDVRLAQKGLEFAKEAIKGKKYQMVILDEVNVAIDYGLLSLSDVLQLIKDCPREVELVLTGRNAQPELIAVADLVSEVREIKHPFQKGVVNRVGIDH
ncbi:cob(I)yrinic acid a,c-diamide adenosyltransferase [candidate division WOR-3 bacterium]|nr:cob(I)yrinic acid a,c-diamide adenosyltransferase [candidate division WOR-3 bacterium]